MSVKRLLATVAVVAAVLAVTHSASILDFLEWDDAKKLIQVPELRQEQSNRNCMCKGPACICCVDFNITFVDLGGPGCVHMKYISPEDGFSVNVSYGKNLLHSSKIQGANPAPICLEVFGKFAQLCAKFSDLAPTADGLRGCLELEPKLLGETQLDFPIGCFKSTAGGMEMEDPPEEAEQAAESGTEASAEEENGFDAETFLAGVYQTAEQGVAFLSSLLDLPNKLSGKPSNQTETTAAPPETTSQETQQRRAKNLKHPNRL